MVFRNIQFNQFRNIQESEVSLNGREILLIGKNGQGKTNFLEAIYLLCFGNSFRNKTAQNFIKNEETQGAIIALAERDGKQEEIKIQFLPEKKYFCDKKQIKNRKEIIDSHPVVVFKHEDIELVQSSNEERRHFFDQNGILFYPDYLEMLLNYKKLLHTRNLLLKEKKKSDLIDILDLQLVQCAKPMIEKRKELTVFFNQIFNRFFSEISELNGKIEINYVSSWENKTEKQILELFKEKRGEDFRRGFTTTGIHRDKYSLYYKGSDFTKNASTGQRRLCSILFKLSQSYFLIEKCQKKVILLLDDVLLELDKGKRKKIIEKLNIEAFSQLFFAFLPDEVLSEYQFINPQIFDVEGGTLYERS